MRAVLIASTLAGFLLGVSHVDWQWAIEHAQVLAGIVSYPSDSPLALQHAAAWSLIGQMSALALWAGVTEATLSWWISGLLGALACAAIVLSVFAVSRRPWSSLAALAVVIVSRAVDWGVAYPITLYGTGHTYGAAGLAVATLSLALIGAGALRTGVFLALISVAVHPALGALSVVTVAAAAGWSWWSNAADSAALRLVWPAAALGVLVVGVSYAAHLSLRPDVDATVPDAAWPLLHAFIRYWDGHRQPIGWGTGAIRLVAGLAVVGVVVMRGARRDALAIWWRAVVVVSLVGLAGAALTAVPPEAQPRWLIALMPGRLLNLPLMLAIPVLIGLALSLRGNVAVVIQCGLAAGLLASRRSLLWPWVFGFHERGPEPPGVDQLTVAGVCALVILLVHARQARQPAAGKDVAAGGWGRLLGAATLIMVTAAAGLVARDAWREWRARRTLLTGSVSEDVLKEAGGARAILIGGDFLMVQLRTRRPIVLDSGALDVVTYAPAAAPAVERMLNDLYGVSLLAPPEGMKPEGRVPVESVREAWRRLTRDDWRRLSEQYGFSHVVAYPDWDVQLPSLATGGGVQTFQITTNK